MFNSFKMFFNSKQALNNGAGISGLFEIDENARNDIQKALLDMYSDVYAVCQKYDIELYLCGGSALGAVRHQGFIPWDDDLDTAMTRRDYSKFVKVFQKELSDRYELVAPNYHHTAKSRFPKILKKGTLFREATDHCSDSDHCGIFLDIFLIENIPNNKFVRKVKGLRCNLLEFIGGKVGIYENRCEALNLLFGQVSPRSYALNLYIGRLFSFMKAERWYDHIDRAVRCRDEKSKFCGLPTGRKHYFGEILPRNMFMPGKKVLFEGKEVLVFSDVEHYLENLYGDYMSIPTPEKREKHFIVEMKL